MQDMDFNGAGFVGVERIVADGKDGGVDLDRVSLLVGRGMSGRGG